MFKHDGGFFANHEVGFSVVLPALAVTYNNILRAHVLKHGCGNLARISAFIVKAQILRTHGDAAVLHSAAKTGDVRIGSAQNDLAGLCLGHKRTKLLNEALDLGGHHVHLPVSCNYCLAVFLVHSFTSHAQKRIEFFLYIAFYKRSVRNYLSWRQATPGSSLPSRNSSDAPPPVEICVILSA